MAGLTSTDLFDSSFEEEGGGRHGVRISSRDPLFVRGESLKPAFLPEEVVLFLCIQNLPEACLCRLQRQSTGR